jgi:hypothetical protein
MTVGIANPFVARCVSVVVDLALRQGKGERLSVENTLHLRSFFCG